MLSDLYAAEYLSKYREMEIQKAAMHAWKFPAKAKTFNRVDSLLSKFRRSQTVVCCQPCC
jgi:hypothetical protein